VGLMMSMDSGEDWVCNKHVILRSKEEEVI